MERLDGVNAWGQMGQHDLGHTLLGRRRARGFALSAEKSVLGANVDADIAFAVAHAIDDDAQGRLLFR